MANELSIKIITTFDYPPIPVRNLDWSAHDDGYEAEFDGERRFSSCIVGHGRTEAEAVIDYWEQRLERHGE